MARIGLKYPAIAKYTVSNNTVAYTDGTVLGKAIKSDIQINCSDDKLYADDSLAENCKEFIDGTIALSVDDLSDANYALLLGHTVDDTTSEISANGADSAPYVGVGFYGKKIKDGTVSYRAVWLAKVLFAEPQDTSDTKGQGVTFGTPTLNGTISTDLSGNWKYEKTFTGASAAADALAWVKTKAGIT